MKVASILNQPAAAQVATPEPITQTDPRHARQVTMTTETQSPISDLRRHTGERASVRMQIQRIR